MSAAAIAYQNLSDAVAISASSSIILAPPATLQNPLVARKWRGSNGSSEYLTVGYISSFDTVLLRGVNLSAAGVTRLRIASADTSGLAADVYDSGSAAGRVDPAYGTLLFLLPSFVSGYVRIDLNEPGASYIEAGRLAIMARTQFTINFGWGWGEQWNDLSQETQSRGGQEYIDQNVSQRCWTLQFDHLNDAERAMIQSLDRVNGIKTDFLFIGNPDSTNLGRDSIWGRVKKVTPIFQPVGFRDGGLVSSKSFEIYERL